MRPNRKITGVLLLAAFAAVGCSKRDTKAEGKPEPTAARPASFSLPSPGFESADEEGFVDTAAKITSPVSFADGEAAYHARDYGKAAKVFELYTAEKPENAWGHFMFGLSAWKTGDPARAEAAFEKALSIDPDHVKSLVNLSRVLLDQKRSDEALDKLTRAGDIDPTSPDVHRLLGRAYHAQGKIDDAVDAYRRAIELDDKDAWSMNNLALLFLEQKRADEAVPLLMQAVELKKDVPAFHNNLGMALEHAGSFTAAADAYKGALTADPGYAKAQQNLARIESIR